MTITANLADGRVLNFPDGTDPDVVQNTVKKMVSLPQVGTGTQIAIETAKKIRSQKDIESFKGRTEPEQKLPLTELFTGKERTTPETERLSEISKMFTGDIGRDLKVSLGVLATADPQAQIDIIKKADPNAKIKTDEKGNTFVKFGEGEEFVLNKPGLSEVDLLRSASQIIPFIPIGKLVNAVKATIPRILAGATAAGVTETGIQAGAKGLGSEQPFSPQSIVEASVLGGAAEVVAPAIQATKLARQRKLVGAEVPGSLTQPSVVKAKEAQEGLKEATGVDVGLFPGQQTQIPTVLKKQSFVGQLPAGSEKAIESLTKQNKDASDATLAVIEMIAPPESIVTGPARFRTAAQKTIDSAKRIRSERVSPIYKKAFENKSIIGTEELANSINSKIKDFPEGGEAWKTLKRVNGFLKGDKTTQQLHNVKLEIDQMIDKFGEGSLGKTTKKQVVGIKNMLVDTIEENNPIYRKAREKFIEELPGVEKVTDSIIGKAADIDTTQLKNLSKRIFDPAESNPQVIKDAKKVIQEQDPEAWNELVRGEVERRMGAMKADITEAGLSTENIPGQILRSIFGNQKQSKILFEALDGKNLENMRFLKTVLERATQGRALGSPTQINKLIEDELKGASGALRNFIKKPLDTIAETGEDALFDRNVSIMADMVFNRDWQPKLNKLKRIKTNNPASAKAMTQLLKEVEESLRDRDELQ